MTNDTPSTLLIQDDFGDLESLVTVHLKDRRFVLANGEFTFDEVAKTAAVTIAHTWAKVDADTPAKVAHFVFERVTTSAIVGVFHAKLVAAHFYPEDIDNQFTDAFEESEDDLIDANDITYLNTGYDELPPLQMDVKGQAAIELFSGSPDKISEKVRDLLRH